MQYYTRARKLQGRVEPVKVNVSCGDLICTELLRFSDELSRITNVLYLIKNP